MNGAFPIAIELFLAHNVLFGKSVFGMPIGRAIGKKDDVMRDRTTSVDSRLQLDAPAQIESSRWHVLLATWLGEMFDGMDASIFVLVIFPAISELLATKSHSVVGVYASIILATFMVGWAIGGIGFGILADYIGRTRTLVYTILLYAIFTGLCAFSHSWQEMAIYRFLVGCGIGGEISIGGVLIAECWRGKSRLYATGVMCSSFGCGYLVASLLNLFLGNLGWRWLFVVGIIPALLTAYIRAKLKEPIQFELMREYKQRLRAKPKTELTVQEAEILKFTLPQIFQGTNISKTLLVTALASTAIVGYWAVLSWIPPWINQLTGTAAVQERSIVAIALNIGSIVACLLAGALVTRIGRQTSFYLGFFGALLCCLSMFLTTKAYSGTLIVWAFFVNFFAVLPFVVLFIYVPEIYETKLRATAFGFCIQFGRLVAAVATITGGQLIGLFGGSYAKAGAVVSLFYILGIFASLFVKTPTEDLLHDVNLDAPEATESIASPTKLS
jgi:MFS family permease